MGDRSTRDNWTAVGLTQTAGSATSLPSSRTIFSFTLRFRRRKSVEPKIEEPSFRWTVQAADEGRCTVVFEPVGSEFVLEAGDCERLLIHVYGLSNRLEQPDVEVDCAPGRITFWIAAGEHRVWNRAGDELRQL
jgi:hypothetical protein